MNARVYIETTIPSYLTARPGRDLVRLAQQLITREWWAGRDTFEVYTSRLVLDECRKGDAGAVAERLKALDRIPILDQTASATSLAGRLVRGIRFPIGPPRMRSISPSRRFTASTTSLPGTAHTSPMGPCDRGSKRFAGPRGTSRP